ncbi:MAG: hypothetical protein OER95_08075 [Acidimicrobiia bacterium]|nr:hypothetical protein [Acidimicrobiia bacterium]
MIISTDVSVMKDVNECWNMRSDLGPNTTAANSQKLEHLASLIFARLFARQFRLIANNQYWSPIYTQRIAQDMRDPVNRRRPFPSIAMIRAAAC